MLLQFRTGTGIDCMQCSSATPRLLQALVADKSGRSEGWDVAAESEKSESTDQMSEDPDVEAEAHCVKGSGGEDDSKPSPADDHNSCYGRRVTKRYAVSFTQGCEGRDGGGWWMVREDRR